MGAGGLFALLLEAEGFIVLTMTGVFLLIGARHAEARRLGVGDHTERLKVRWSDIALGSAPGTGLFIALILFGADGHWIGVFLTVWIISIDLSQRRRARSLERAGGPRLFRL
jgi:hypothetical protein